MHSCVLNDERQAEEAITSVKHYSLIDLAETLAIVACLTQEITRVWSTPAMRSTLKIPRCLDTDSESQLD